MILLVPNKCQTPFFPEIYPFSLLWSMPVCAAVSLGFLPLHPPTRPSPPHPTYQPLTHGRGWMVGWVGRGTERWKRQARRISGSGKKKTRGWWRSEISLRACVRKAKSIQKGVAINEWVEKREKNRQKGGEGRGREGVGCSETKRR